ncbi:MAG TPA: PEGA domain-containing protein [Polyangium sp.]|nr:PEGA domain-containing protein [Polyangium sp.]
MKRLRPSSWFVGMLGMLAASTLHSEPADARDNAPGDKTPSDKAPGKDQSPAKPGDKPQDKTDEAARILFDAGAKAYAAGIYDEAVTAFREAHALEPNRPTLLFSLAQAERRQYTVKPEPAMLEAAIAHFRKYLEVVPEGGRRADVVVALGELESLRANAEAPTKKPARIFITTETPLAVVYVDGKKHDHVPVIEESAPGKHEIKIEAPGFLSETREITAVEGAIFPLEINLQEKPSFLALKAPPGSSITIDGRAYGDAPLQTALEIPSGTHQLVVMHRGYVSFDERVSIVRAETTSMTVALKPTTQRRVSYALFGTTIAALGASTALAITTIVKDAEAAAIYNKARTQNIDRQSLMRYADVREDRNILLGSTLGTIVFSLGLGVATAATYWFDSPVTTSGGSGRRDARISLTPLPGGGYMSVGAGF